MIDSISTDKVHSYNNFSFLILINFSLFILFNKSYLMFEFNITKNTVIIYE